MKFDSEDFLKTSVCERVARGIHEEERESARARYPYAEMSLDYRAACEMRIRKIMRAAIDALLSLADSDPLPTPLKDENGR